MIEGDGKQASNNQLVGWVGKLVSIMNEGGRQSGRGPRRDLATPQHVYRLGTRVLRLAAALLAARPRAAISSSARQPAQGQPEHVSETYIPFLTQPEIKSLSKTR